MCVHSIFSSGEPLVRVERAVMNSLKVTTPSRSASKPANKSSWMNGSSKPIPFMTTLKSFFVIVPCGASFLYCLCKSLISFVVSTPNKATRSVSFQASHPWRLKSPKKKPKAPRTVRGADQLVRILLLQVWRGVSHPVRRIATESVHSRMRKTMEA